MVIGLHHVISGYGFWAVNDPRGSGSIEIREEKFEALGPIHRGRKITQPSRQALKSFHQQFELRLKYPVIWFSPEMRNAIADAVERLARERGYTVWAYAAMRNHQHILTRVHRDRHEYQWGALADATREVIRKFQGIDPTHPVWSLRPYTVFKDTPHLIRRCIDYINDNPEKEGLPRQSHRFAVPYDDWRPVQVRR